MLEQSDLNIKVCSFIVFSQRAASLRLFKVHGHGNPMCQYRVLVCLVRPSANVPMDCMYVFILDPHACSLNGRALHVMNNWNVWIYEYVVVQNVSHGIVFSRQSTSVLLLGFLAHALERGGILLFPGAPFVCAGPRELWGYCLQVFGDQHLGRLTDLRGQACVPLSGVLETQVVSSRLSSVFFQCRSFTHLHHSLSVFLFPSSFHSHSLSFSRTQCVVCYVFWRMPFVVFYVLQHAMCVCYVFCGENGVHINSAIHDPKQR